ncbi:MAG: MFS transporter, partial [Dehalococcoidia bacterium]
FSPKRLTSATLVVAAILMLFQGWAPVFAALLLGRLLYGLTIVAREPARALLIKQWMRPKEIVIANATIELLWGVGGGLFILFPLILKLLDDSWRNTFYLFGGISLAIALVWQVIGKERVTSEYVTEIRSQVKNPIGTILRYKELWVLAGGVIGLEIAFSAMSTFWPSYMLDTYGFSLTKATTIRAIGGFVAAPGALAIGILVSRAGRKKLLLFSGGILMALSYVGMLYTGSFFYLALISIANGISITIFPIIMTIPFELPGIRPREVAVASAFVRTAMMGGAIIGPVLTGAIHQASGDLRLALTISCLAALSITTAAILLPRNVDRLASEQAALNS